MTPPHSPPLPANTPGSSLPVTTPCSSLPARKAEGVGVWGRGRCLSPPLFGFPFPKSNLISGNRNLQLPSSPGIPLSTPKKATPFSFFAIYGCPFLQKSPFPRREKQLLFLKSRFAVAFFSKNAPSPAEISNSFSQNRDLRLLFSRNAPSQPSERKNNHENAVHD